MDGTTQQSDFLPAGRLGSIGVSEILKIGAAAARLKREGRPVIVLGSGEPDFDTPDNVKQAAEQAIRAGKTKYPPLEGTPELKAAIVEKFRRENGLSYALDEVTVSSGAKAILYNAFMASLDPGDEVILAAPYWTTYADIVRIAGGTPVDVVCREENGFRLAAEGLERAITPRTRWLLLNSPSNPSGAAYTEANLRPITEVLLRHPHVWLMSDDIYEHLVYDGLDFVTAAQIEPSLKARTLTVNGVSKAYAMTGWRIGYAGGPKSLIAAMAVVQSQISMACSVSQAAAVEALNGPQEILAERRRAFQRRRDLVVDALNAIDGITCRKPEGAFYTFASCAGLIGRTAPDGTVIDGDTTFCRYLLEQHDVAVVPGSCCGLAPYFRISYAASEESLREACACITHACETLS